MMFWHQGANRRGNFFVLSCGTVKISKITCYMLQQVPEGFGSGATLSSLNWKLQLGCKVKLMTRGLEARGSSFGST